MATFPDVPDVPGVPPLPRLAGAIVADVVAVTADALGLSGFIGTPQWGIFDQSGNPVIIADSVVSVDYRKEYRISDFPVENGGFASYNKVATPFDAKIGFTCGGSDAARAVFIAQIEAAIASLSLYSVVMPEFTFPSVNVIHYDWRRTARNGATLLSADVWLEEVRVTATAQFSNTQQPSGADPQNGGTVQAQTPTSAQSVAAAAVST